MAERPTKKAAKKVASTGKSAPEKKAFEKVFAADKFSDFIEAFQYGQKIGASIRKTHDLVGASFEYRKNRYGEDGSETITISLTTVPKGQPERA